MMTKTELLAIIAANSVEEGDCVIWLRGKGKIPQITRDGTKHNIRKLLTVMNGGRVSKGSMFGCSCGNSKCVAEEHISQRTRQQHGAYFGNRGAYSGPLKIAKMAATKRSKSKLNDEKVAEIRASTKSAKALSAEFGVAASYITSIRNGNLWKNYSSPFAGLGALGGKG